MDLADPTRSLTPTLDGPILAVLAQSGRPLTVGQIAAEAARGSEIGIRRSVARLVQQGIVRATQMGRNQVHELNRDHVAAPIAELLSGLRLELWRRLRETLAAWDVGPVYAGAFGSAARGDGGPDSDIDVLLVHPPLPGEEPPPRQRAKPIDLLGDRAATWRWRNAIPTAAQAETWHAQVDELHAKVQRWTGNPLQLVDISIWQWMGRSRTDPELFREIEDDAVALAGQLIPLPPRVR